MAAQCQLGIWTEWLAWRGAADLSRLAFDGETLTLSLPSLGALKLATAVVSVVAAAIFAMEPTVQVAIIASIAPTVLALGTLILGLVNRSTQAAMKESIDGHFTKLLTERQEQGAQLVDKTDKLAHAEGRREGVEASEGKPEH